MVVSTAAFVGVLVLWSCVELAHCIELTVAHLGQQLAEVALLVVMMMNVVL